MDLESAGGNDLNVLIVDDQASARTMLRHVVEGIGPVVKVSDFGNPIDALRWSENNTTDLLLLDYRMPTSLDLPKIEVVLLETPVPGVPYGVRGVAEMPIVPVAATIGNAVRRAIGIRITEMPMTPERIVRAIKNAGR